MKKIETIWHHLLFQTIEKKEFQHTQAALADSFGFSTSTINLALDKPTSIGAIRKSGKFFVVSDPRKLLYLAATIRNLTRDTLYHTNSILPITELEGLATPDTVYGGYTAAKYLLGEPPADYNHLYLYAQPSSLPSLKLRYPKSQVGNNHIVVLDLPPHLPLTGHTSLPLTFVDIWNMSDWYAHDFIVSLEAKINGLLS